MPLPTEQFSRDFQRACGLLAARTAAALRDFYAVEIGLGRGTRAVTDEALAPFRAEVSTGGPKTQAAQFAETKRLLASGRSD